MADLASSAEQRCLKLVSMAETAAKEQKKKLMAEIRNLEAQLHEREELCTGELDNWESRLNTTTATINEQSQLFQQKNGDTIHLLETLASRRSEAEARLISEVKELLTWFHRFQQFEKRRRVQTGFLALQQGPLAANGDSSPTNNKTEPITKGAVTFDDFIQYVNARTVEEGSTGAASLNEKVRTVMNGAYGLEASGGGDDQPGNSSTKWIPTPKERKLVDGIVAAPITSKTLFSFSSDSLDESTEVPFSMQSVILYLCGAVEMLESFSDRISTLGQHIASQAEERIRGKLLNEERQLLRKTVEPLVQPVVEISSSAQGVVLLQKLYDDRETRFTVAAEAIQDFINDQSQRTKALLLQSSAQYGRELLPMVADGLYMTPAEYSRRIHTDISAASAGASGGSGSSSSTMVMGKLQGMEELIAVGPKRVKSPDVVSPASSFSAPPLTHKGSFTSILDMDQPSPKQSTADQQSLVVLVPKVNQHLVSFAMKVTGLEEKALQRLMKQHSDDFAHLRGEFQALYDRIVKKAHSEREITFINKIVTFDLEEIAGDVERRELLSRVQMERQQTVNENHRNEMMSLQSRITDLEECIKRLKKENSGLKEDAQKANRDAQLFADVAQERNETESLYAVMRELRILDYEVNEDSFGESWQESLLKLRERTLNEIAVENTRIVSRVRNLVQRSQTDANNLETLFEARLQNAVEQMESDNRNKFEALNRRHDIEKLAIHDEFTERLRRQEGDHEQEVKDLRSLYDKEYLRKVEELNLLYEDKVRRMRKRAEEQETRFASTLQGYRTKIRDREREVEERFAARFSEMFAYFENEASKMKDHYAERQRELERERIQVQTNVERRINDKVQELRVEFDELARKLQQLTLTFLESQRAEFESYREREMNNVSQFVQVNNSLHKLKAVDNLRELQRHHENAVAELRLQHEEDLIFQQRTLEAAWQTREHNMDERLLSLKDKQEDVLRITQDMRIEQDEAFWSSCHDHLLEAEELVITQKSKLEVLLQTRYLDVVQKCEDLLSKELAARRDSFEREQKLRTAQFHKYCHHYHHIQLRLEKEMWLEVAQRAMIEKQSQSIFFSLRVQEEERRRNLEVILDRQRLPFEEIGQITLEQLTQTREEYENRLKEAHSYSGTIMRDYVTALEVELKNNSNKLQMMDGAISAQVFATVDALQQKAELYNQSRQFIVENRLDKITALAERCLNAAHTADQRSYFRQIAQLHRGAETQEAESSPTGRRGRGRARKNGTVNNENQSPVRRAKTSSPASGSRGRDRTPLGQAANQQQQAPPTPRGGPAPSPTINRKSTPSRGTRRGDPIDEQPHTPRGQTSHMHDGDVRSPTSASLAIVPNGVDVREAAYLAEDVRVLEYFTYMKGIVVKTMEDMENKLTESVHEYERQRRNAFRQVHEEYVETTSALMKRMEGMQRSQDFNQIAVEQLQSQLMAKNAEIIQAATIRADLESMLSRELVEKQQKLREDMVVGSLDLDDVAPVVGGSQRHHNKRMPSSSMLPDDPWKLTNLTLPTGGPRKNVRKSHQQIVSLPRSVLMDLASLRERVFCNEWLHFNMSQNLQLAMTPHLQQHRYEQQEQDASHNKENAPVEVLDDDDVQGDQQLHHSVSFVLPEEQTSSGKTLGRETRERAAALDLKARNAAAEDSDWNEFANAMSKSTRPSTPKAASRVNSQQVFGAPNSSRAKTPAARGAAAPKPKWSH